MPSLVEQFIFIRVASPRNVNVKGPGTDAEAWPADPKLSATGRLHAMRIGPLAGFEGFVNQ